MNIVKEGMNNIKYHMELGATATCAKRTMGASKGLDLMDVKGIPSILFLKLFSQICRLNMRWMLVLVLLAWLKPTQNYCVRITLRRLQSIGQEFITLC